MKAKNRIELTDNVFDIMTKMAEGNPGGLSVLMKLYTDSDAIDPDSALGGLGVILDFDQMGIYGSNIWILFKDVCGQDVTKLVALLRAKQLGYIEERLIVDAAYGRNRNLPLKDLFDKVRAYLPDFAPGYTFTE